MGNQRKKIKVIQEITLSGTICPKLESLKHNQHQGLLQTSCVPGNDSRSTFKKAIQHV